MKSLVDLIKCEWIIFFLATMRQQSGTTESWTCRYRNWCANHLAIMPHNKIALNIKVQPFNLFDYLKTSAAEWLNGQEKFIIKEILSVSVCVCLTRRPKILFCHCIANLCVIFSRKKKSDGERENTSFHTLDKFIVQVRNSSYHLQYG